VKIGPQKIILYLEAHTNSYLYFPCRFVSVKVGTKESTHKALEHLMS